MPASDQHLLTISNRKNMVTKVSYQSGRRGKESGASPFSNLPLLVSLERNQEETPKLGETLLNRTSQWNP